MTSGRGAGAPPRSTTPRWRRRADGQRFFVIVQPQLRPDKRDAGFARCPGTARHEGNPHRRATGGGQLDLDRPAHRQTRVLTPRPRGAGRLDLDAQHDFLGIAPGQDLIDAQQRRPRNPCVVVDARQDRERDGGAIDDFHRAVPPRFENLDAVPRHGTGPIGPPDAGGVARGSGERIVALRIEHVAQRQQVAAVAQRHLGDNDLQLLGPRRPRHLGDRLSVHRHAERPPRCGCIGSERPAAQHEAAVAWLDDGEFQRRGESEAPGEVGLAVALIDARPAVDKVLAAGGRAHIDHHRLLLDPGERQLGDKIEKERRFIGAAARRQDRPDADSESGASQPRYRRTQRASKPKRNHQLVPDERGGEAATMRSRAPHKKGCPIPQESSSLEGFPGDDLLSHAVAHAVPSALRSLTTVFGMGTGVTSSLQPPRKK